MSILKVKAFKLRSKKKSYNEINRLLGIPKSTLSCWFKADNTSTTIKKILIKRAQRKSIKRLRLMSEANKEKWQKIHLSYRLKALHEYPSLIKDSFFIPGLISYWGEGDKKLENGIIRISNTDYRLLKIFIIFLLNSCRVMPEKIRLWLLLYPDLNEEKCKNYWSKILNIPKTQFIKSQFIIGREKKRTINYGVCYVQVYSRELKEKIIEWINLYGQCLK